MKRLSILISLLLGCFLANSQYSYFNEEYNNDLNSGATGIYETDSGYIIGGWSEIDENGTNIRKILLTTTDNEGNQLSWETFGEVGWYYFASQYGGFTRTSDGGFAICGQIMDTNETGSFMMRFDGNGDSLWTQTYYVSLSQTDTVYMPNACMQLPDKGFILAGQAFNWPGGTDALLMRTDSLGNILWLMQYGIGNWTEGASSVTLLPDGGFLVGTVRYSPLNNYEADAGLLKTDSLGNMIWLKYYGGQYEDGPSIARVAEDGNYLVGCTYAVYEYYPGYPEQRAWIFKTDTAGNILWEKIYGRCNFMGFCTELKELENGNIILSGLASYTDGFGTFGWILKTNSEGDSLWMHDYYLYPEDENYLYDMSMTSDGGIILAGCTFGPPLHVPSVWVEKLDDLGLIVGVEEHGGMEAWGHGVEVWPNPASGVLSVEGLMLNAGRDYEVFIYDFFGNEVLVKSYSTPCELNVSFLVPGIYLAVVKNGHEVVGSQKFLIER